MHPDYNRDNVHNDIALVKIVSPITFNPDNKVAPACLPTDGATYSPGTMVTVAGWGTLYSGRLLSSSFYIS